MTSIAEHDPAEWLRQFMPTVERLDYDTLRPVLSFTLIWNLFELVVCDRYASIDSVRRHVDSFHERGKLEEEDFEEFVDYFHNRYAVERNIDNLHQYLLSRRGLMRHDREHIKLLQDVLLGRATDLNNIVFALLFIAYRIRNNLFHGEKDIFTLNTQMDLFSAVNALLCKYMEVTDRRIRGQQ